MSSRFRTMRRAAAIAIGLMAFSFTPAQADEGGVVETVVEAAEEVVGDVDVADPDHLLGDKLPDSCGFLDIQGCLSCDGGLCPIECLNPQGAAKLVQSVRGDEGAGQASCGWRE